MKLLIITNHQTHSPYDSIYAMASSLQNLSNSFEVFICSTSVDRDHFYGKTKILHFRLFDDEFNYEQRHTFFERTNLIEGQLSDFDAIFFRIDRVANEPDAIYDYFDFAMTQAPNAFYVNHPKGLNLTRSKEFLEEFPELCPEFIIAQNLNDALEYSNFFPVVLKPLTGYGGEGIIKIISPTEISVGCDVLIGDLAKEFLAALDSSFFPVMAMRFLPRVSEGDKRIVVVAGQCLGAVLRTPKRDSWLANLAQGATSSPSEPNEEELKIIEKVDDVLRGVGICVYGIDTLVDDDGKRVLSEVNTANVGGFLQIQQTSSHPVLTEMAQLIKYAILEDVKIG